MIDVHFHVPASTQKKDGPSTGIATVRSLSFPPQIRVPERWVGQRDGITLGWQMRPAHYGNNRRGACLLRQSLSTLVFGLDHAPWRSLTRR